MTKYKVIFDTDPGVDDMMALFMMAGHADIDIVALTTTYGNASIETTTRNALFLADMLTLVLGQKIPVYQGVHKPIMYDNDPNYADFVHGVDGLGDTGMNIPSYTPETHITAAEYIVKTVRDNPHEITLVAVGPLGNVSLAMMLDPQLPALCKDIFIMGCSFYHPGNITPSAEANTYNSPHETDIVFGGNWSNTSGVVGLDVTCSVPLSQSYLKDLTSTGILGQKMWDMAKFYLKFYETVYHEKSLHCHDAFAVAMMTNPEIFTTKAGAIRVVTDGISRGQTVITDPTSGDKNGDWNRPKINVAIDVDGDAFRKLFANCIRRLP